jgi:hypothetical protein
MYTFSEGMLRGFRAGGSAFFSWKNRGYYYYPNGVNLAGTRELFQWPTMARFDAILGYDWRIRGRNSPSGPFHYFWPHGTLLTITGQRGNFYRVQLAGDMHAWVPVSDITMLPAGTPPPGGEISGARFVPTSDYVDLRIATPERLAYHVNETETGLQIDVFGGISQVNFFQYGKLDPLIERAMPR